MLNPVTSPESSEIHLSALVTGWSTQMRNPFNSRKRIAIVAASAAVILGGATALAYWTTTGSGSGTGTAASSNGTVVLAATVPNGLFPGGSVTVPVSATTSAATDLYVTSVSLAITPFTVDADHSTCDVTDLSFDLTSVLSGVTVPHGVTATSLGHGVLALANSASNQEGCKGAIITVHLTSN
jgi:hypothetical protein